MPSTKFLAKPRGRRLLPQQCIIKKRLEAALASDIESNARPAAELWLGGLKMLPTTTGKTHWVGKGKVGTGERAHDWALILRDEVERREMVIEDQPNFTDAGRELLRALGVKLVAA